MTGTTPAWPLLLAIRRSPFRSIRNSRAPPEPLRGSVVGPMKTKSPQFRTERTMRHGPVLERHQDAGRSVRAYAPRHLLCRETDREVAARHDRKGFRLAAQTRLQDPSG